MKAPPSAKVRRALADRNRGIARFWLDPAGEAADRRRRGQPALAGHRVLLVDGEDGFTAMLAHQLRALGPGVTIRRHDEPYDVDAFGLVVVGPGPGAPEDANDSRIAAIRHTVCRLLESRHPFMAVCLGHQVLCSVLGLPLIRKNPPNQGCRRQIDYFGRRLRAGFYNTFAAVTPVSRLSDPRVPEGVDVSRDPASGEVHALRGPRLRSTQFHPESLLTEDGTALLGDDLRPTAAPGTDPPSGGRPSGGDAAEGDVLGRPHVSSLAGQEVGRAGSP